MNQQQWKTFGNMLKAERHRRNLTRRQIALLAGMGEQNYGAIERGAKGFGIQSLAKIAAAFGMKPSELMARWEARL